MVTMQMRTTEKDTKMEEVVTEKDLNEKKSVIKKQIIQAVVIMLVFYAIEIVMVYLDIFPDYNTLLIADMVLRIILGTVSIILIKSPRRPLFTNNAEGLAYDDSLSYIHFASSGKDHFCGCICSAKYSSLNNSVNSAVHSRFL